MEITQPPLPGDAFLAAFSHPYYLTWGFGDGDDDDDDEDTLWKVDGAEVTRVENLENLGFLESCLAREILVVNCSPLHPNEIKLKVFSSLTDQLIKDRVLTPPTAIQGISSLKANTNQLVVEVRQQSDGQSALLVYELDTLLFQLADHQIFPRKFQIGQPGFPVIGRIYLNNTTVTASLQGMDTVKFITMDFWNCQD